MGADIKSLRIRIRSVDSTLHLTKAMGLVASSKIRRATMNMNRSREYTASMEEVVGLLRASPDCAKSPYMTPKGQGDRVIVIAGDRGLAGGYNANIFRLAATLEEAVFTPIGKRACDRYGEGFSSSEHFAAADAKQLADDLCAGFLAGEFGRLGILYTRYKSLMTQMWPSWTDSTFMGVPASIISPWVCTSKSLVLPSGMVKLAWPTGRRKVFAVPTVPIATS